MSDSIVAHPSVGIVAEIERGQAQGARDVEVADESLERFQKVQPSPAEMNDSNADQPLAGRGAATP